MRLSESFLNRQEQQWNRRKFENRLSFPPRGTPHEKTLNLSALIRHSFFLAIGLMFVIFVMDTALFAAMSAWYEQTMSHKIRPKVVFAIVKLLWIHKMGATWLTPLFLLLTYWSVAFSLQFTLFWAWNRRAERLRTASPTISVVSPDVWPPPPNIAHPS